MPLLGFIFGGGCLILSLLPQKYSSFQNASLKIYIRWWSFNLVSFASKISKFSKYLSPRFIFGGGYLILSLLPKKYSSFQNTSFRVYIRRQSFNPIHLFEIYIQRRSFNPIHLFYIYIRRQSFNLF